MLQLSDATRALCLIKAVRYISLLLNQQQQFLFILIKFFVCPREKPCNCGAYKTKEAPKHLLIASSVVEGITLPFCQLFSSSLVLRESVY